jgi:aspartate carbamoyltransferase catalytic subunit
MRHPEAGSAATASKYALVPVINAGDGIGEHPTQVILFYLFLGLSRYFHY